MNNAGIRYNVSQVLKKSFKPLFLTFIMILLITRFLDAIPYYIGGTIGQVITIILSIATLTLSQGQIRAVLKAVSDRGDQIVPQEDGIAGIKGFFRYISTYLVTMAIYLMVALVLVIIISLVVVNTQGDVLSTLSSYYNEFMDINALSAALESDQVLINALTSIFGIIVIGSLVAMVVYIYLYLNIALAPYLLEKYDYRGLRALTMSYRFMKGRKFQLFRLILSYLGWILVAALVGAILVMMIPDTYLFNLLSGVAFILIFQIRYQVAMGIFFEEVDLSFEGATHE